MGKDTKIGLLVGVLVVVLFALVFFGGGGTDEDDPIDDGGGQPALATTNQDGGSHTGTTEVGPRERVDQGTSREEEADDRNVIERELGGGRPTAGRSDRSRETDGDWEGRNAEQRQRPYEPTPPASGTVHEVKAGDSYYTIAKATYGKSSLWPIIKAANQDKDLFPGMKIVIPPKPAARVPARPAEPTPSAPLGANEYQVKSGDNLWNIAAARLGNGVKYMLIFEANKDTLKSPDQMLRVGMRLRLPARDAVLPRRTTATRAPAGEVRTARRTPAARRGTGGRAPDID